jgi:hypothetical protein
MRDAREKTGRDSGKRSYEKYRETGWGARHFDFTRGAEHDSNFSIETGSHRHMCYVRRRAGGAAHG